MGTQTNDFVVRLVKSAWGKQFGEMLTSRHGGCVSGTPGPHQHCETEWRRSHFLQLGCDLAWPTQTGAQTAALPQYQAEVEHGKRPGHLHQALMSPERARTLQIDTLPRHLLGLHPW